MVSASLSSTASDPDARARDWATVCVALSVPPAPPISRTRPRVNPFERFESSVCTHAAPCSRVAFAMPSRTARSISRAPAPSAGLVLAKLRAHLRIASIAPEPTALAVSASTSFVASPRAASGTASASANLPANLLTAVSVTVRLDAVVPSSAATSPRSVLNAALPNTSRPARITSWRSARLTASPLAMRLAISATVLETRYLVPAFAAALPPVNSHLAAPTSAPAAPPVKVPRPGTTEPRAAPTADVAAISAMNGTAWRTTAPTLYAIVRVPSSSCWSM